MSAIKNKLKIKHFVKNYQIVNLAKNLNPLKQLNHETVLESNG